MISGISHITFIVKDLNRTADFFTKIFEAQEVYSSSATKYFLVNDVWIALNKGQPLAEQTYNHVAFQISEADIEKYTERIKCVGAEIKPSRPRIAGEGYSIYFYDFDNHLFELHTGSLSERLAHYSQR
jgi:catechol 2,3-dioxygenase-like lactoylglutathione lyase family enzyme